MSGDGTETYDESEQESTVLDDTSQRCIRKVPPFDLLGPRLACVLEQEKVGYFTDQSPCTDDAETDSETPDDTDQDVDDFVPE